jgi:uncharacterized protein
MGACRHRTQNYIPLVNNPEDTMRVSQARIPTQSASRYLQQLCKHWSHKFAVEFTPEKGSIPFAADRRCLLEATPGHLALRIEAADEASIARMEGVVADHLRRFAFREDLGVIAWRRD